MSVLHWAVAFFSLVSQTVKISSSVFENHAITLAVGLIIIVSIVYFFECCTVKSGRLLIEETYF